VAELTWLDGYAGQTIDELLALASQYRIDSLVVAMEEALDQKSARLGDGGLSEAERAVLAVEALEREVNNGGYGQFFTNSSSEHAAFIVDALVKIGCSETVEITRKAVEAVQSGGEDADEILEECDAAYFDSAEPIAERLFAFVEANKSAISLP
jgi:hypothetical protein